MSVRRAVVGDLEAVLAIEHAVFSDAWSADSFAPEFDDPYAWFSVYEMGEAIVGYVVARIVAGQAEIANIAVDPSAQRRGIGGHLLDAAIVAASSADCEAVWLEVRPSNPAAQCLYASRGFEVIGRRPGYYRLPVEDALVMRRDLSGAAPPASE
jgi:[ribosomal protein S18]-alanine N-acetyltransferase